MSNNINVFDYTPKAINDRVLVTNMHFGEQKTSSGLIIKNDDGTTRGIYPRWAQVFDKGPKNKDIYNKGDWILIEHGQWTRSFSINLDGNIVEVRMVDADSVLAYSSVKPNGFNIGEEFVNGQTKSFNL